MSYSRKKFLKCQNPHKFFNFHYWIFNCYPSPYTPWRRCHLCISTTSKASSAWIHFHCDSRARASQIALQNCFITSFRYTTWFLFPHFSLINHGRLVFSTVIAVHLPVIPWATCLIQRWADITVILNKTQWWGIL